MQITRAHLIDGVLRVLLVLAVLYGVVGWLSAYTNSPQIILAAHAALTVIASVLTVGALMVLRREGARLLANQAVATRFMFGLWYVSILTFNCAVAYRNLTNTIPDAVVIGTCLIGAFGVLRALWLLMHIPTHQNLMLALMLGFGVAAGTLVALAHRMSWIATGLAALSLLSVFATLPRLRARRRPRKRRGLPSTHHDAP